MFHELTLRLAVSTVADALVDEDTVRPGACGAEVPLLGVRGHRTEEEDDLEGTSDLKLLDADAGGPVPISMGGAFGRRRRYRGRCAGDPRDCAVRTGRAVQHIDLRGNCGFDGCRVINIEAVELRIRVPKRLNFPDLSRYPERGFCLPEGRQSCSIMSDWHEMRNDAHRHTSPDVNESVLSNGSGAIGGVAGSHPDPRVQGRPKGDHPIDIRVMQKEDGVKRCSKVGKPLEAFDNGAKWEEQTSNIVVPHMTAESGNACRTNPVVRAVVDALETGGSDRIIIELGVAEFLP